MQFSTSTRNKDIVNSHFTITFFIIVLFLKLSTAKLIVYDKLNNVMSSYDNTDFMGIDKPSYGKVVGKLIVASFSEPISINDDPCKIKNLPLDVAIDIVVIPFQEAYNIGCKSYSQIIVANNWKLNKDGEVINNAPQPPNKTPGEGGNDDNEPHNNNNDNNNNNNNDNNNNYNANNEGKNPQPQPFAENQQDGNPKAINNNDDINNIPNGKGVNNNDVNNNVNNDNAKNNDIPNNNIPNNNIPNNNIPDNNIPNNNIPNNNIPNNNIPNDNIPNDNIPNNNNNNDNNNNNAKNNDNPPVNNVPNDQKIPVSVPEVTPLPETPPNDTPKNDDSQSSTNDQGSSSIESIPNNPSNSNDQGTSSVESVPNNNNNNNNNDDIVTILVDKPTILSAEGPTATADSQSTPDSQPQPTADSQSTADSQPTADSKSTADSQPTADSKSQSTADSPQPTDTAKSTTTDTPVGLRKRQNQENYGYIPKVVVFSSMNGGEPGIKELYNGDRSILKASIPGLTLLKYEDITQIKKSNDKIDHAEISSGDGKWYGLVTSPSWVAWSVIMSLIYGIIIIVTTQLLIAHYNKCGFTIKHIQYYCYPGIALICIFGIILLLVDPGDVYEDRLSLFSRSLITNLKALMLMIFFTILEVQWKDAASMICQTHNHHYKRILIHLNKLFSYILAFCIFIFISCFFIKTLSFLDTTTSWFNLIIKLSYILESISIGLLGIEFVLFGSFIISAINKKCRESRLRYRKSWTDVKTLIMSISCISAVIFLILSGAVQFLLPTLVNFWIQLILGNIATATSCIIIIVVLQDEIIGKHRQMAMRGGADLQINTDIPSTPPTLHTPQTPQTPQTLTSMTSLTRNLSTINELPTRNEMTSNRPSIEYRFRRLSGTNYSNRLSGANNFYRYSGNYSNRFSSAGNSSGDNSNRRFSSTRNSMYSMYASVNDMTYSSQSFLDTF
jgi:hypothetical protein